MIAQESKTFVYPTDYGSNAMGDGLSPMGQQTLRDAVCFLKGVEEPSHYALGICGGHLPDMGMDGKEALKWKQKMCAHLPKDVLQVAALAASTIDEAENSKRALDAAGIQVDHIILYCERWHSFRVYLAWRKTFGLWAGLSGGLRIETRTMARIDSDDYILPAMRDEVKWININLVGFVATVLWACGLKWVATLRQPAPPR